MKRIAFAFPRHVLAFFAIFVVVGCSGRAAIEDANVVDDLRVAASRPAARPETVTDAMVEEGQQIYAGAGICAVCHGPDATGAIGPNLTDAEWLIGDGEYEQIVTQILEGVSLRTPPIRLAPSCLRRVERLSQKPRSGPWRPTYGR